MVLSLSEPPLGSCGRELAESEVLGSSTWEQPSTIRAFFVTGSSTGTLTGVVASTVSHGMISVELGMSELAAVEATGALPSCGISKLVIGRALVEGATEVEVGTTKSELATSD